MTGAERIDLLVRGSYLKPNSHLRAAFVASVNHLQNDPPQWDNDIHGFRRRFADRSARFLSGHHRSRLGGAIGHGSAAYSCEGAGRRLWHVFAGGFRTYNRAGEWPHYSLRLGLCRQYIVTPGALMATAMPRVATGALVQLGVGATGRLFGVLPELKRAWRVRGK